ncbi:MAG: GNAT family N-acetyltransferase [Acidobacteriota bacterium]
MEAELIRPIRWNDLAGYRSLLDDSFSSGPGKEETRAALLRMAGLYSRAFPLLRSLDLLGLLPRSVPRIYVCRRGGEVAGAICLRRRAPGAYYVVHMAVGTPFRRLGIASRLRDFAVARLPAEPGLRLLARHRSSNEPQARSAAKFGYRPYLREHTLSLTGDGLRAALRSLEADGRFRKHRPTTADFRRLRLREIPPLAVRADPTLADPCHEQSKVMELFNKFALHTRLVGTALEREGRVAGIALTRYHRLQKTHEAEFALDPDSDADFIRALGHSLVATLLARKAVEVRVRVWDFQPRLRRILLDAGFREMVERILVYRPL